MKDAHTWTVHQSYLVHGLLRKGDWWLLIVCPLLLLKGNALCIRHHRSVQHCMKRQFLAQNRPWIDLRMKSSKNFMKPSTDIPWSERILFKALTFWLSFCFLAFIVKFYFLSPTSKLLMPPINLYLIDKNCWFSHWAASLCMCYLFRIFLRISLICSCLALSMPKSFRWRMRSFVPICISCFSSWGQGYNTFFSLYLAYSASSSEIKITIFYKIVTKGKVIKLFTSIIYQCCL